MYPFEARLPVNHVLSLVKNIRSGEYATPANFKLTGAALGEIGAFRESGFVISLGVEDELPSTIDGCLLALDTLTTEDPAAAFDPSLLIPIVLKLIELWLARRGG